MSESLAIIGGAVGVGGAVAGFAVWAFRSVVAQEVTPALVELKTEAGALTREFRQFRETKEEERKETARILKDLDSIVQNHEVTLAQHALRLDKLDGPPPARAARKGRAA